MYYYMIKDITNEESLHDTLTDIPNTNELIMRKVKEDVYFLICDNAIQANLVINISTNDCKLRMLKDSPDDIRYIVYYVRDTIREKYVKTLPGANLNAINRIVTSHLRMNQKFNV